MSLASTAIMLCPLGAGTRAAQTSRTDTRTKGEPASLGHQSSSSGELESGMPGRYDPL